MKKIKEIIKKTPKPDTFGTNPRDPWSTRSNISEGRGWLDRYLASKGLDPRFVTPNQKVSYAKSGDFLKWKNDRILRGESVEFNEDTFDPKAATQTTPNVQDVSERRKQMSKSARIIKSIYKKKQMKEDTFDWEKEDKSVKTYGKKPNMEKIERENGRVPDAAAVLSGGKTLTGTDRDNIEIDPMMKYRPGQNEFDSQVSKKKY